MKILYYTWNETMAYDIEETLDVEGHDVVKVSYPISSYVADKGFNDYIVRILDKDNFDCIFTMNYIPALAKISFLRKIKYIAWISDSPNYTTYSEMIHSPYNYIFHFDKKEVENLRSTGAKNIFHMPLAVNTKRVTKQIETSKTQKNKLLLFRRKDIKMKRLPKYTPAEVRNDPYGFTYKEMSEVIGENEAKALYEELYKQLPRKKNLSMLVKNICKSSDTEKYVYELKDNKYIETVFIKRRDGGTVCVSTQVGCPVGCIFCESGRNGFVRNLTSSEIVQQIILLRRKVNRIVFMGMGEPLFNYDNLIKAIHILRDRYGLNFPTDGITISTVGPVDQLKKLREEHLKIQLTISLHAATQSARNRIIPHMRIYAIEDVVKQALSYSERHNRKIVFAYLLLPGINDRPSDVRQLAKWFRGKKVMINVLQYNPTSNSRIKAPQKREIVAFKHQLEQAGLEVTMRVSHGREINAACGQLANTYNKFKKK